MVLFVEFLRVFFYASTVFLILTVIAKYRRWKKERELEISMAQMIYLICYIFSAEITLHYLIHS